MRSNRVLTRLIWAAVVFLAFIGIAVVARRTSLLLSPSAKAGLDAQMDAHFARERALTLLHIFPGAIFMMLGPLQFIPGLRAKHRAFHRWSGRIFLAASGIIGVTGLIMAWRGTIGGAVEQAAIFVFAPLFLFSLSKALWHAMHREFAKHREWMIRGFAIGLAVATVRPIVGAFFAAAALRGQTPAPSQFFGKAFWIGFTAQTIAAELWIRWTRQRAPAAQPLRVSA